MPPICRDGAEGAQAEWPQDTVIEGGDHRFRADGSTATGAAKVEDELLAAVAVQIPLAAHFDSVDLRIVIDEPIEAGF